MSVGPFDKPAAPYDPRYPLGTPVNRKQPERVWIPIPRRPGWVRHRDTGQEVYVEPPTRLAKLFTGGR